MTFCLNWQLEKKEKYNMINPIQTALERKKQEAAAITNEEEVRNLAGHDWPTFLHHMNMIMHRQKPWDQIIACEVFDLINTNV